MLLNVGLEDYKNKKKKLADKPGSVVDSHSSRRTITHALQQPTR